MISKLNLMKQGASKALQRSKFDSFKTYHETHSNAWS